MCQPSGMYGVFCSYEAALNRHEDIVCVKTEQFSPILFPAWICVSSRLLYNSIVEQQLAWVRIDTHCISKLLVTTI